MPRAVHAGNYGLMQIRLGTARGVGYSGDAKGLLDADTNLTYAVKYLAGAYRAAGCDADRAVSYYQRGYYGAAAARMRRGRRLRSRSCASRRDEAGRCHQAEGGPHRDDRDAASRARLPARPVGNFEPARVAPPPVQPVAAIIAAASRHRRPSLRRRSRVPTGSNVA